MTTQLFYTEQELGDMLGVHESKVAEWRRRYAWPHIKLGRQIRFSEADVRAIATRHHVETSTVTTLPGQTARSAARSR